MSSETHHAKMCAQKLLQTAVQTHSKSTNAYPYIVWFGHVLQTHTQAQTLGLPTLFEYIPGGL